MTRTARAVALTAVALALVPAASQAAANQAGANHAAARVSRIIQSDWNITSASGTQTLTMSGSDPGLLDSFTANITARWRTTTSRNHMLTFSWPVAKITSTFPDPRSFAVIDKAKVEMIGSANGTFEGASGPTPFSCKANTGRPVEGYLPAAGVPITGGAVNNTHLGLGALVHPDPRVLFRSCAASGGLNVLDILSSEQIVVNKSKYTPVAVNAVKTGHTGKKATLTIKVTEPIKSTAGATVGTVVSKATLHLKFVAAI